MSGAVRISIAGKTWPAVAGRRRQPVLGAIELDIAEGSFVILTGPSGCGKSTLLNIVAGLDTDYSGSIAFDRQSPALTYIFQSPRLLPWLSPEPTSRERLHKGGKGLSCLRTP